jgi:hypothetical protein
MTIYVADAVACLREHPDYRVLKRLDREAGGGPALTHGTVRSAAIIDTETTGMDPKVDQIIEIGRAQMDNSDPELSEWLTHDEIAIEFVLDDKVCYMQTFNSKPATRLKRFAGADCSASLR